MESSRKEQNKQKRIIIPKLVFIYIILYCGLIYFYFSNPFYALFLWPFLYVGIIILGVLWVTTILFSFLGTKPKDESIWRKTIVIILSIFFLILPAIIRTMSGYIRNGEFHIHYWYLKTHLLYVSIFSVLPLIIGIIIFMIKIKIDRKYKKMHN